MTVIDGKLVSSKMRDELKNMISDAGTKYGKIFKLTVIIVGNDPASEIYRCDETAESSAETGNCTTGQT